MQYNEPISISIIITHQNGCPCIELRKRIYDINLIKSIISSAFINRPLIIMPSFSNKIKSISTLIDKGIISKRIDNNDQIIYDFLI